jgi:tetratricopeptide (TPR) repeat protein
VEPRTDFFISYTQADRAWAEWIAWTLEEAGYKAKIQAWDFPAGSNFVVEMHRAAAGAERTLAVLSPDYLNSLFGMTEWAAALAQDPTGEKGKLLPVRVQEVSPDGLLAPIVYIDLVGLTEPAARERLLGGLLRERAKPAVKPAFPGGPRPRFPGEPIAPPDPEEAQAQLHSLPEDEIPEPGPLPPSSHMPFSRNPLFVGREDDLRTLARTLKAGETAAVGQIAAATGLGGIGKTQLASEFVHRYGRFFAGGVFWMSFAEESAVSAEVVSSGRSLGLHPDYDNLPLEQQVRLVEEAWESPIPRLVVFDNCEDPALLDRWRPRHGGSRVLVTSRRSHWDPALGVQALTLGILKRSESLQLLRGFREDLAADDAVLNEIAEELGDLPLALHLAGSFLARYRHAPFGQPAAYLKELRRGNLLDHPSLRGKGSEISPTGHERHVARTFALDYESLDPNDPVDSLAQRLIARAAYFAPGEPIPRPLLFATTGRSAEGSEAYLQFEEALDRAVSLGMLDTGDEGSLVMHRLVAVFSRNSGAGDEDAAQQSVEDTLLSVARWLNNSGYPVPLFALSHLVFVTDRAREREDERTAGLCANLGTFFRKVGEFVNARVYLDRSLAIQEKMAGQEHPETARCLNNLGSLLSAQGDYAGARKYHERALAIWENASGSDHPDTAVSLNNLGYVLFNQGDYEGAFRYHERALTINERMLGVDHIGTVTSLNNLGFILFSQGDYGGARKYYEQALVINEKLFGLNHPGTATCLNNLGGLLDRQGDTVGALSYFQRALAIRERILGPDYPETARSLNNVGYIFAKQGDYAAARSYYDRSLSLFEKVLGPDHPDVEQCLSNLGLLLARQDDYEGARECFERALAILEKALGPDHPRTANARSNLASLNEND